MLIECLARLQRIWSTRAAEEPESSSWHIPSVAESPSGARRYWEHRAYDVHRRLQAFLKLHHLTGPLQQQHGTSDFCGYPETFFWFNLDSASWFNFEALWPNHWGCDQQNRRVSDRVPNFGQAARGQKADFW